MIGPIAQRMQHLRQQPCPGWPLAAGPSAFSGQIIPTDLLRVISCQDRCPRRPAAGGVIELSESQAILGESIKVRRLNLAAVTANIRKAEVISQDDQNVWFLLRLRRESGTPFYGHQGGSEKEQEHQPWPHALNSKTPLTPGKQLLPFSFLPTRLPASLN